MKEQHGVLDQLKEYGYSGRDETTKVRDLLGGIKTEALKAATSTILSTNEYFDGQVAQLTKQVSALTEKLEAQSKVPNVVSNDMSTSTTELTEQTNRSNPALSRQKTQGKWPRTIAPVNVRVVGNVNLEVTEVNTDLDSHADQCVVGRNALIVYDYDKPVNIVGYDPNGPVEPSLSTVSAALAYDCPTTGSTIILIVNQAIHNPKLDHNLLSTFQMRLNEVMVNDIPKCLTDSPTEQTHAIIVTDLETNYELLIPLSIQGVTSTFPTRKPTQQEYDECIHFDLTYDSPEYEPTDTCYERMERQSTQTIDRLQATGDRDQTRHLHSVTRSLSMARVANDIESDSQLLDISHIFNDHSLAYEIKRSINVASVNIKERRNGIDAQMLARNFGIGLDTAQKTLKVTTQRGVRSVANPTLSRRFRTNDRQLRYKRLPVDMFTDTMISKVKS
jgi:hypothetical protein